MKPIEVNMKPIRVANLSIEVKMKPIEQNLFGGFHFYPDDDENLVSKDDSIPCFFLLKNVISRGIVSM